MMQIPLPIVDGYHVGPLFILRKIRPPIRIPGEEGQLHRAQTRSRTPPWSDLRADCLRPACAVELANYPLVAKRKKGAHTWPDMPMEQIPLL